jgi:hypothetical protein
MHLQVLLSQFAERFPDARVRRRLVEIEVAAPLDPAHHHR